MKMSENFLCCERCFENIGKINSRAAKMWLSLCDIAFASKGIFGLETDDPISLRILEINGYILSHEQFDHLSIKVFGEKKEFEETIFCPMDCDEEV